MNHSKTIAKTFCQDHNIPEEREQVLSTMIESYAKEREDKLKQKVTDLLEELHIDKEKIELICDFIKKM
jgi:dGTP triphosphohydrolase